MPGAAASSYSRDIEGSGGKPIDSSLLNSTQPEIFFILFTIKNVKHKYPTQTNKILQPLIVS